MSEAHAVVSELLGAYALHAVDPDEAAAVEAHLHDCVRCRAELAEHTEVAALLGNSGADAPEGIWDRIASALEETPPPLRVPLPSPSEPRGDASVVPITSARRPRRVALLAAAAAVAVVVALGAQVVRQQREIDDLQSAMVDDALLSAANHALAAPDGERSTLLSPDGSLHAVAVVMPDGTGFLMGDGLPELASDRTYQLWGQVGDQLVSLGVLGTSPEVVAFRADAELEALAITDEVGGGVQRSEHSAVVAGRFT